MTLSHTQQKEIIAYTTELIRINESSGHESKTAYSIAKKMEALGYDEVRVDKFGSVQGLLNGNSPGLTLLFDGHMDVVPVRDEDEWDYNPFGGEVSGGRIWGRGSADMKGALAAMIYAPSYLKRSDFSGRIVVSASVGEEISIGTALNHIIGKLPVDAIIIGEPTGLKIGNREKGRAGLEIICTGKVAHSSHPELGDNAIYAMMKAVQRIRALARLSHPLLGEEVIELVEISSLPSPGNGFIPHQCRALWECRLLHDETKEQFLRRWEKALEDLNHTEVQIARYELRTYTGEILKMEDFLPGWITESAPAKNFTELVASALSEGGKPVEYYGAPYGCNALVSASQLKIPTVILGPGDIALAHKPNEHVIIEDLCAAAEIYRRICEKFFKT